MKTKTTVSSDLLQSFALDIQEGLSKPLKTISPRYIYDDMGSRIFEQIMELPEYYLTRCEHEILKNQSDQIATLIKSTSFNLVELGAGNGEKTELLINEFLDQEFDFTYYPIDISEQAVMELVQKLQQKLPHLSTNGIVGDYFDQLGQLKQKNNKRNVVLFLGSNIGNFSEQEAIGFLYALHENLNKGDILVIGYDLKKDFNKLIQAYDDSKKVTKAFHMNLLHRINHELGGNFDMDKFDYYTTYNPRIGAIDSFIISLEKQTVFIEALEKNVDFDAFEPIHTEYSYKYSTDQMKQIAEKTGFRVIKNLSDAGKNFCNSIWEVI